jgi:hypothetical protein
MKIDVKWLAGLKGSAVQVTSAQDKRPGSIRETAGADSGKLAGFKKGSISRRTDFAESPAEGSAEDIPGLPFGKVLWHGGVEIEPDVLKRKVIPSRVILREHRFDCLAVFDFKILGEGCVVAVCHRGPFAV